jgi:hypothetical protein
LGLMARPHGLSACLCRDRAFEIARASSFSAMPEHCPGGLTGSLVLAVARGRTWAALRRGEYADIAAIAGECGLGESYVRRMLRLAYLAPDVVEAIAEGRQPRGDQSPCRCRH